YFTTTSKISHGNQIIETIVIIIEKKGGKNYDNHTHSICIFLHQKPKKREKTAIFLQKIFLFFPKKF
ncbi:MAG: hypothetical protein II150_11065, partial [Thermoguttaceae bacterium]|nr:hypothetical protein [Thermoguttaceae bacterium]